MEFYFCDEYVAGGYRTVHPSWMQPMVPKRKNLPCCQTGADILEDHLWGMLWGFEPTLPLTTMFISPPLLVSYTPHNSKDLLVWFHQAGALHIRFIVTKPHLLPDISEVQSVCRLLWRIPRQIKQGIAARVVMLWSARYIIFRVTALGEKRIYLHVDNCLGWNKNIYDILMYSQADTSIHLFPSTSQPHKVFTCSSNVGTGEQS